MPPTSIIFSDLSHTGKTVDANYFPLGSAFVAGHACARFGDRISVEIFKYPDDLAQYLSTTSPDIACFSNYSWNLNLNLAYARRLKKFSPQTLIVFGGPNFPMEPEEQADFLKKHAVMDFYIDGEGEESFVLLLEALFAVDLDRDRFLAQRPVIPGTHYLLDNQQIKGDLPSRIRDLDQIPSPFLTGLMDKFFDKNLFPVIQTARGCPYACTYCHDGIKYLNKVRRFSQDRIRQEIDYIRERRVVPDLAFTDSNFGLSLDDQQTAFYLAQSRKEFGWPQFLIVDTAKNNKDRVKKIAEILGDGIRISAAVQTTDPTVLTHIKRSNISLESLTDVAKNANRDGSKSASEVILALPGDHKQAHINSLLQMIDAGIQEMRSYQFIILTGTEAATSQSRKQFGYQTRFRVLPRCFGRYHLHDESFAVFETHEVCIGNNTLPYEDYRLCRDFDLTIEIFNNGGMFEELLLFLEHRDIKRSQFIWHLFERARTTPKMIELIYNPFRQDEEKNFWQTQEELDDFLEQPGIIDRYLKGEMGVNQIFQFRALMLLQQLPLACQLVFETARILLIENEPIRKGDEDYLQELLQFITQTKGDLINLEKSFINRFHFDFVKLNDIQFQADPLDFQVAGGIELQITHSELHRKKMLLVLEQFGQSLEGLAHYFQRGNIFSLYRRCDYSQDQPNRRTTTDTDQENYFD
ncbi:MAG: radical SAM protein [Magnetococcales bacterium]|nr:radical SAM protein [Magnetococcales bacterium]